MHNNEFRATILKISRSFVGILPILFWLLIIYGFDDEWLAGLTVCAALIHEGGHLFYALLAGMSPSLSGTASGFRIRRGRTLGYGEELLLYAFGPLFNVAAALIAGFISGAGGEYVRAFSLVNLATGISNLLPIRGHDGYGIARVLLEMNSAQPPLHRLLETISFSSVAFLTLLSLYLMQKCDGGYWIFAVFITSLVCEIARGISNADFENL